MLSSKLNHLLIKNHPVEKKSLLNPYQVSEIPFLFKNKKPQKQIVFEDSKWAQMDLNHRPSDYESDALTN